MTPPQLHLGFKLPRLQELCVDKAHLALLQELAQFPALRKLSITGRNHLYGPDDLFSRCPFVEWETMAIASKALDRLLVEDVTETCSLQILKYLPVAPKEAHFTIDPWATEALGTLIRGAIMPCWPIFSQARSCVLTFRDPGERRVEAIIEAVCLADFVVASRRLVHDVEDPNGVKHNEVVLTIRRASR